MPSNYKKTFISNEQNNINHRNQISHDLVKSIPLLDFFSCLTNDPDWENDGEHKQNLAEQNLILCELPSHLIRDYMDGLHDGSQMVFIIEIILRVVEPNKLAEIGTAVTTDKEIQY